MPARVTIDSEVKRPSTACAVVPFHERHVGAVKAFNQRLAAAGKPWCFPESPLPARLAPAGGQLPYYEFFLAVQGDAVRGGYCFKPQAFAFEGRVEAIANYTFPVSEGTVDLRYGHVGLLLLKDGLKREPLLYGTGIGGYDEAVAQLLKIAKWGMVTCPFFFRVNHPFRFLKEIVFLRRRPARRLALDALAYSGLGWAGVKTVQALRRLPGMVAPHVTSQVVPDFSDWADDLWERTKASYAMLALRDARTLNRIYPADDARFTRLQTCHAGQVVGWAIVMTSQRKAHSHFGGMRIGSVVDCLASPGHERAVVRTATRHLEREDVDVIVTNQLDRRWCQAFDHGGYLRGPSNYIFTVSPRLAERLQPFDATASRIHITRGDGDGPINL
jgi:hypothetical protein